MIGEHNQSQSKGFRTRALGTLFHKMNNDLMTINLVSPSVYMHISLYHRSSAQLAHAFPKINFLKPRARGEIPAKIH